MLPITDITKFSFQDFPEHTACIVWVGGCNFRCPYCHNPEFVVEKFDTMDEKEVFDFLQSRVGLLEGVVISGGECTLYADLYALVEKVKGMGFLVKIDTNGTNFELVKKLLDAGLLDFVALDYKAPKEKFRSIAGIDKFGEFEKTLDYLIKSNVDMEIRTTVHTDLLDEADINGIIRDLEERGYGKTYHIQNYRNDNGKTIGNIRDQNRVLDRELIDRGKLDVQFRNFF